MELTEALLSSMRTSVCDLHGAQTLPPELYTDEAFFSFERESVFGHDWLCLGRVDDLVDIGDFFTVDVLGEPLVVVRGKDAEIRVLSAVCQHRGMLVAEGKGKCSTFKCPYHHWSYALDGRLLGAPAMERAQQFEKSAHGLPQLRSEIWHGFVFCNFDDAAPPLGPTLVDLEPYLASFEPEHWIPGGGVQSLHAMPWNWKVMLENFNDGYHASRLHQGVHDFCPSELAEFTAWHTGSNAIIRTNRFVHRDGGFNASHKALLPIFPGLSDEERSRVSFALLPPTLMLGLAPDQVFYFIAHPVSASVVDVSVGLLFHPECAARPLFDELLELSSVGIRGIIAQDIHATTLVQRGLSSRFARRGRYAWQEEVQRQLNSWLVDRYQRYWPDTGRDEARSSAPCESEGSRVAAAR